MYYVLLLGGFKCLSLDLLKRHSQDQAILSLTGHFYLRAPIERCQGTRYERCEMTCENTVLLNSNKVLFHKIPEHPLPSVVYTLSALPPLLRWGSCPKSHFSLLFFLYLFSGNCPAYKQCKLPVAVCFRRRTHNTVHFCWILHGLLPLELQLLLNSRLVYLLS